MTDQRSLDDWAHLYTQHFQTWTQRFDETIGEGSVDGVVIFSGSEKLRFRDDHTYPLYVEPYFKAWVPHARHPGSALKIQPGKTPMLVYTQSTDFWHQSPAEPEGFWTRHFDIRQVSNKTDLLRELGLPDPSFSAIGDDADESMRFGSVNDPTLLRYLDFYRALKTPYEVACIEEANRIAAAGHAAAQAFLADNPSELALNHAYCNASQQRESTLPYQNIVALNEHAGILHYQNLDRDPPQEMRSFLLDAGAEFNGYASDVTRTCAAQTNAFRDLIDAVDSIQRRLCAGARIGVDFVALNDLAHQLLAEVLKEQGIIRCSSEDGYSEGITRTFLPHGLGHLLGLQVHDAGGHLAAPGDPELRPPRDHPYLRLTRKLEPGFIVTIEPGLYFIPSLLDRLKSGRNRKLVNWGRVDELLPFGGIRIEDNVLVTDGESRNLSRPALLSSGIS